MVVGTARVNLQLHGIASLKDKRSIVRKIVHRVRNEFDISSAETDHLDSHRQAEIGLAVVTNDARLADSLMRRAVNFIVDTHLAEVLDAHVEVLHL